MEKRRPALQVIGARSGVEHEAKRFRSHAATSFSTKQETASFIESAPSTRVEAEFFLQQHLVGWVIGRGGATLREIQQSYEVEVVVDQSTKGEGYSSVRITGVEPSVQAAAQHMNESLACANAACTTAAPSLGPFLLDAPPAPSAEEWSEDMQVEQRFVGWLLGKSGAVMREIEQASGCIVGVNQQTRHLGYSMIQIRGSADQRVVARDLIQDSLERARATRDGCGSFGGEAVESSLRIEQQWVGWLVGKSGGVVREIEAETGARISLDQSSSSLGYSTAQVSGNPEAVEAAMGRIQASLQKVGGAGSPPYILALADQHDGLPSAEDLEGTLLSSEIKVEQKWVGWLLGKGGSVMREIEAASGARVSLNQATKALGYSIAQITGDAVQVAKVEELINDKINQVAGGTLAPAVTALVGGLEPKCDEWQKPLAPVMARSRPPQNEVQTLAAQLVAAIGQADPALQRDAQPAIDGLLDALARNGTNEKETRLPLRSPLRPQITEETLELQVEQRWVGWLLGQRGQTMREIESSSGAKISVDQTTKALGYSVARILGSAAAVQRAHQRIESSLSFVAGAEGPVAGEVAADTLDALDQDVEGYLFG
uniref:K Homology domain-containing protein n=1 Tax=Noctiluca scintillans TaxID=2966 RepID=A0A7S1F9B5_NOCSC|mmetsp:Transcript_4509/g.12694  ORF Transcript_4509/g.12694 Transcript_4509/m.12694 type:complete len:601 (+) Transcript_4509:72-1874(+)